MTVKIRETRCGIPGTRGHWPGCWAPAVATNVKAGRVNAHPGGVLIFDAPTQRQLSWLGRVVLAVGAEGKSLAVSVA